MDLDITCGDCIHCDPDFYEADGECSEEECHPDRACAES